MSRLKRQKLNVEGKDYVIAIADEARSLDSTRGTVKFNKKHGTSHPGRSVFVRPLPANITTDRLANHFSQSFPLKHATVVVDPATKESRGYGFVSFADAEDAQSAKDAFNGSVFEGQRIKVTFAEPRHRRGAEAGVSNVSAEIAHLQPPKAELQLPTKLIVRNLPWTIAKSDQLAALFQSYGKVRHATLPRKKAGLSAGFGFVTFPGRKNAERALKAVNGKQVEGRTLAVDWAVEKEVWETLQSGNQKPEADSAVSELYTQEKDNADGIMEDGEGAEPTEALLDDVNGSESERSQSSLNDDEDPEQGLSHHTSGYDTSTLFVRNLPFRCTDELLQSRFQSFGAVRYARTVLDTATERPKGTGFVCFYKNEDALDCLRNAPRLRYAASQPSNKPSILEDAGEDLSGRYSMDGRVLSVTLAVDRQEAKRLTFASSNLRDARDRDKRRLYLLTEGTVSADSPLYAHLSKTEVKMREDSARQRQSLIKSNPTLHLSMTRLSIRNLSRNFTSKDLKALAREAVVGFAKDVKSGTRKQLSKEELSRGSEESEEAEKARKAKGKGIVKQAKVVFEGREGKKVAEESGAGRSRGYGFIEYSSHRWALMGLRWLNGHAVGPSPRTASGTEFAERKKRLVVEFAIENAQVVARRQDREAKARERSKLISERRDKGEVTSPTTTKSWSKDQLMAKMRKGAKRKQKSASDTSVQGVESPLHAAKISGPDRISKRRQIIGRKRTMRRSRKEPASGEA